MLSCLVSTYQSSANGSAQKSYVAEQATAHGTTGKLAASGAIRTPGVRIRTDDPSQHSLDPRGGRKSAHPGQRNRFVDTFVVFQVTKRPLVAAVQMVGATFSL